MNPALPLLVIIAGPTGAGKTAIALALAAAFPCEVINADSRQVYQDFPIITAQPSAREQAVCPHRLYGYMDTGQKLGAGEYARLAREAVQAAQTASRLPVLVGGTGLYIKALLQGIAPIPAVDPAIHVQWQARCATEGSVALHKMLTGVDQAYAAKIHPHDQQRITRALEVWEATGQTFTWWHTQKTQPLPFRVLKLGVSMPMAELEPRLAIRIDAMLAEGAVEEARAALANNADPKAPGWSGIGCRELFAYLTGTIDFATCRALWQHNTRAYAKRQNTWFRADTGIHWLGPLEQSKEVLALVQSAHGTGT